MTAPRIVAGQWRGRPLRVPPGRVVRPTSARMREALFNIWRDHVEDATMLDLFAGTGAVGLEALSRGASHVTFVERDREALAALEGNLEAMGACDRALVMRADARRIRSSTRVFDLVFIDPPYAEERVEQTLGSLADLRCLTPASQIAVEHQRKTRLHVPAGFAAIETRNYGLGGITFLQYRPD